MKSKIPLIPYLIWMAIFVVVPLGMVLIDAFTDSSGAFTFANFTKFFSYNSVDTAELFSEANGGYSLQNLLTYLLGFSNLFTFFKSLWIAVISTGLCLVMAYPIALLMARQTPSVQRMLHFLIMLPMWMNFVLRICSWILVLQSNGILDSFLHGLGIDWLLKNLGVLQENGTNFLYQTSGAVVLGIVYNYLPFMILPIYTTVAKIPKSLYEAGEDLGCSRGKVLTKIIFPLSVPGVISGITMVFVPAMSSFVISQKLGGFNLMGDMIDLYYKGAGSDPHLGAAVSTIMMVFIVLSIVLLNRFDKDDDVVLA